MDEQLKQLLLKNCRLPTEEALARLNAAFRTITVASIGRRISAGDSDRKEREAAAFFSSWQGFGAAEVPFAEWEPVAAAALKFLESFLRGSCEDYESAPGFDAFWDLRQETMKRLENDPRYRSGFRDLQGR